MGSLEMKFTEEFKNRTLKLLRQGYPIMQICIILDISEDLLYSERKSDSKFKENIEKSKEEFRERRNRRKCKKISKLHQWSI
jgi:transposase-like protein